MVVNCSLFEHLQLLVANICSWVGEKGRGGGRGSGAEEALVRRITCFSSVQVGSGRRGRRGGGGLKRLFERGRREMEEEEAVSDSL
jgi:hypothetical protein